MKPLLVAAALLGLLGLHAERSAPAPGPRYTVLPLQSFAGTQETGYYVPQALNNKGECVGMAWAHRRDRAVRWDAQGKIHVLGKPSDKLGDAVGINDRGQAIAYATVSNQTGVVRFYLVDAQRAHRLTPLTGTEGFLGGEAVNDAGQAAFNTRTGGGLPERAFLSDHGTLTDLGHLPLKGVMEAQFYSVRVHALNNSGMAAGQSEAPLKAIDSMTYHAFLWRSGVMTDLGAPSGYDSSSAKALNDRGEVIGTMQRLAEAEVPDVPDERVHGFYWENGGFQDLGALPGCAYTQPTGINSRGQVVGNSYNLHVTRTAEGGYEVEATGGALNGGVFLWQNGHMVDLQTLVPHGWQLQSAVGINDRGEILCTGYHAGMPSRTLGFGGFILRPL